MTNECGEHKAPKHATNSRHISSSPNKLVNNENDVKLLSTKLALFLCDNKNEFITTTDCKFFEIIYPHLILITEGIFL